MSNRWKIIWIATLFNILFEYSLRGVNNLVAQPFLPLVLFPIYFTLFTMVEDLIVRFKLKAYHLMILAFAYGTIYDAFTSGILFIKPTLFGIDVGSLLFVNIIWWGALQAILTFYLTNLIAPRDWNHHRLGTFGWILCLVINCLMLVVFQLSGKTPHATPLGLLTTCTVTILSLVIFVVVVKGAGKNTAMNFIKSKFLSALSILTVILFIFTAVFLTHDPILANTSNVNATSLRVIIVYTILIAVMLLGYRIFSKKEIPV